MGIQVSRAAEFQVAEKEKIFVFSFRRIRVVLILTSIANSLVGIGLIEVSFAKLVFLLSLYAHVGAFAYYTFSIREDVWTWLAGTTGMIDDWWVKVTVLSSSFSCLASVLGPLIFYIGINLMKDIDSLRQQLSSFNIKRCKCYCCSVSHQDPVTKMRIPCDREVIFATLEEWYGGPIQQAGPGPPGWHRQRDFGGHFRPTTVWHVHGGGNLDAFVPVLFDAKLDVPTRFLDLLGDFS